MCPKILYSDYLNEHVSSSLKFYLILIHVTKAQAAGITENKFRQKRHPNLITQTRIYEWKMHNEYFAWNVK